MTVRIRVTGKVGIITGAASGIGAAVAIELAGSGASLLLVDRSAAVHDVAESLAAHDATAFPFIADVADFPRVQAAVEECKQRWGRVNFLVTCAGILDTSHLADGDPAQWRATIDTNLLGTALCIRAVLPVMKDQGDGHIVVIASVSGLETYAGEGIYIASKWGVVGLAGSLRREVVGSGVRTTVISPGIVDTPLLSQSVMAKEWLARVEPLHPEDVARVVVFALAQPARMAINHVVLRPEAQDI